MTLYKAYNYFHQFAVWTQKNIFFVTRQKKNAVYTVIETVREHKKEKKKAMVLREELIELEYIPEDETRKRARRKREKQQLRRICYQDEQNRQFVFLTNAMDISAEEVACLYKK